MSGTITVSSTTDSQEQVEQAAEYGEPTLPFPKEEKSGPSEVDETGTAADSEPAEEQPESEEPEEAEEQEPPEAAEAQPMGQTRKGLTAQVRRQAAEITELREQIRKLAPREEPDASKPESFKRPDANDPKYRNKGVEDVMEDMVRYTQAKDQQAKADHDKAEQDRKVAEWLDGVKDRYNQQLADANAKYSDFQQVVGPVQVGMVAEGTVKRQEVGAEVAYALAKQYPHVLEKLAEWDKSNEAEDANRIVQTLQNLADRLRGVDPFAIFSASPDSSSPQPRPAVPRPLRHVGGASTATTPSINPEKMSMKDYNAWRDSGGGR